MDCINGTPRALYEESISLFFQAKFIYIQFYSSRYIQQQQKYITKNNKKTKNMDDSFEDFVGSTENENRQSYLLTYAQADIQKLPNC